MSTGAAGSGGGGGGSGECLRPWSAPAIKMALEYTVGDRPSSTDPAQDRMWRSRVEDLVFWANRRPDVAARTLACSFFSETAVVPPATSSASTSHLPKLPSKLHDMCQHALQVHASCYDAGGGGAAGNSKAKEIPQEEVTFMATLVEPCVRAPGLAGLPNCRAALDVALRGHGKSAEVSGMDHVLLRPLARLLSRRGCRARGRGSAQDGAADGGCWSSIPPEQISSHALLLPASLAASSDTAMLFPLAEGDGDRDMLHRSCSPAGVAAAPFRVRGREETARDAIVEDARLRSSTLVRAEGRATIARPQWAAEVEAQYSKYDEAPGQVAGESEGSGTKPPGSPSGTADERKEDQSRTEGAEAAPEVTKVPTTVVDDGDLVFVKGRFTVVPRKTQKSDKEERTAAEPQSTDKRVEAGGGQADGEDTSTALRKRSRPAEKDKDGEDEESLGASSPTGRGRRRQEKRERIPKRLDTQHARKPVGAAVVSVQGVPLKAREELVDMVNAMNISDTLREAFLIGLEPPPLAAPVDSGGDSQHLPGGQAQQQKRLHLTHPHRSAKVEDGETTSDRISQGEGSRPLTPRPATAETVDSTSDCSSSGEPLFEVPNTDSFSDDG